MQQNFIIGNGFQRHMNAKFNVDINSASSTMANVRGKENFVYEYINKLASIFQPVRYGTENPSGLYADYNTFKRDFVRYWRNALDIPRPDSKELEEIFDDAVTTQESCRNINTTSVFFENGKALSIDDCLYAIYEVFKMA